MVVSHNPCLSGGALEIFLEPQLAAPADRGVRRHADRPRAGGDRERAAGYDVADDEPQASDAALVVASHGSDEEPILARALKAGVGYVGLVASKKRGAAVLAALDVPDALRALVHTPAGLDIGARTPADIAISILAEIVATRTPTLRPPRRPPRSTRSAAWRSSSARPRRSSTASTSAARAAATATPRCGHSRFSHVKSVSSTSIGPVRSSIVPTTRRGGMSASA